MNPGSAWTIAASGALTATYATIANSNASVSPGTANNSVSGGGNINWVFAGIITWVGGGGNNNWSTAANWSSNQVPNNTDTAAFSAAYTGTCILDKNDTVGRIVFNAGYTGAFNFSNDTLTISNAADFRTGGSITAGTGALQLIGTTSQLFYPAAGNVFPAIIQNGIGGAIVSGANLVAGDLTITSGEFNLGTNLSSTVGNVSGAGSINFGTACTLAVAGATANFSSMSTITAGTGALSFTGTSAQVFTPKSGAAFPGVIQNGTGGTTI